MLLFFVFFVCFMLALMVLLIAAQWKVYEKAGKPGWACLIPFYNIYVLTKIAGKPGWWLLLLLIPGINIIFSIWLVNMVSKSFGKDEGFTVGLLLLGIVFWPILGFSRDIRYIGPYGNRAEWEARQRSQGFDFENPGQDA
jgi:hypothetical protein